MKFMMDLVTSLITSMHEYISENMKSDRTNMQRQALQKEQKKFEDKLRKFKLCEQDLKIKVMEFEDVFNILQDLKVTYD